MADTESGIQFEAEVYWSTAQYIADAKRLNIMLTREDIDQIRANAMRLHASRYASVRRCARNLPVVIVNAPA